ncbi:MAG: trehalose-phosphatase [Thermovirgaceae bacterium]
MKDAKIDVNIGNEEFDAVLFDLDGVITQTAKVHAASWKKLFDEYLEKRSKGKDWKPFDISTDYVRYVDGKPRYEGVKSFLESRRIDLPWGSPEDPPEAETVCGLGNRKNGYFHEMLKKDGVTVFESATALIAMLRAKGFKTAVVTSSKNGQAVLEIAGLQELFDTRVDGTHIESEGLKGKPDPDIFLKAAREIGTPPERAVVFEDAESGVAAGKKGGFGLVIGVDRTGHGEELLRRGADRIVTDLSQVTVNGERPRASAAIESLPSAMENFERITAQLEGLRPFVALDYDGTLTPIVDRPEDAVIPPETRETVEELSKSCTLVVISGRDLKDVRSLVGIDSLVYAGSHGFDISGPKGLDLSFQQGDEFLPTLDSAESRLRDLVSDISGAAVERKKYSIAIHYRLVANREIPQVEAAVDEVLSRHEGLIKGSGKKVFELRPDLDWDKGKALLWLLDALGFRMHETLPMYFGDDTTDEDAFAVIRERGIGIVVTEGKAPREETSARYSLPDTGSVRSFLEKLRQHLKKE